MGYCERPSLALSSLAGAGAHRTQTWLFARLLCALSCVPALVVCASFVPVACFSTVPLLRSHLAAPTRYCVGASCVRAGGGRAGLLWACLLAGGWGLVFALLPVFVWVFALLGVGALDWGGGAVWSRRPPCPGLLACVLTPWCGLVGVCAVLRARWAEGGQVGAGQSLSRPFTCVGVAVHRPMRARGRREGLGVRALSWCANTRARREMDRGERGGGVSWGGPWWPGWGGGVCLLVHTIPILAARGGGGGGLVRAT